jgi:hypothetical protein
VDRAALRVAGYRFRATFRRRWGGYVAPVVVIALVGGRARGAVAVGMIVGLPLGMRPPSRECRRHSPGRIAARTPTALLLRAE